VYYPKFKRRVGINDRVLVDYVIVRVHLSVSLRFRGLRAWAQRWPVPS